MPKWAAYGRVVGNKYLGTVDADTEEEAREKAFKLDACSISVCHQCSDQIEDPEISEVDVQRE